MGCSSSKPAAAEPQKTLLASDEAAKAEGGATNAAPQTTATPPTNSNAAVAPQPMSQAQMGNNNNNNVVDNHQDAGTYNVRSARTLTTQRYDLDVMVSQFISHDSTVGAAIGRNWQEKQWKVMYDLDQKPVDIKLQVQEHKLHRHEVGIESNGQALFSGAGGNAKAKMNEDFTYQWPFRAAVRGVGEINYFECRPDRANTNMWVPATITAQRDDGFFAVTARQLDERGYLRDMTYPAVHKDDLREAASRRPLVLPESTLVLKVPKNDPTHAQLIMGGETVTHHFGRPSPPPLHIGEKKAKVDLRVSKDRNKVEANVGHDVLSHFISGEVRAISSQVERLMHSWTLQVGPFAKHSIKVTKNHTLGKIITLVIDDETFVECTAADLGCKGSTWQCSFRFVGERMLDFEVFKTNSDGTPLDETAHVEERRKYVHDCIIVIPNDHDFSTAQFFVDAIDFRELPMKPQYEEAPISMDPRVMTATYGIQVPYKVDPNALSNIAVMANSLLSMTGGSTQAASGFFSCCGTGNVASEATEIRA